MQAKKTVIVMSLGQLHNASVSTGILQFSNLHHEYWGLPSFLYPVSVAYSAFVYAYDKLWSGGIDSYRCGNMKNHQFINYLKSLFGSGISDSKITTAWNSVCNLGANATQNEKALKEFLSKHTNVKMLLLSSTNGLHFDHSKAGVEGHDQIILGLSFKEGVLSIQEIATKVLKDMEFDHLISLHRDIKASDYANGKLSDSFQYNPSKDGFIDTYLESLVKQSNLEL